MPSTKQSRQHLENSTDQSRYTEELAVIGRLVAGIVHEMRNPLSALKMNLRILEKKVFLDALTTEHMNIAKEQVERLEKMLRELLEYSKPVRPVYRKINLKELLRSIIGDLKEILKEKKLIVETDISDSIVNVTSDEDLLRRIIENLITNAAEASPPGETILLCVGEESGSIRIEVIDHGKGMSEKVKSRLFEPFFTTRGEGTGLGMSNVKRFVEALNAAIEVNTAEGKGTKVTIILPKDEYDQDSDN
jgi:signal transduction histidine kinase